MPTPFNFKILDSIKIMSSMRNKIIIADKFSYQLKVIIMAKECLLWKGNNTG